MNRNLAEAWPDDVTARLAALDDVYAFGTHEQRYFALGRAIGWLKELSAAPRPASAALLDWQVAALLKDRTRRAIRERATAGDSHADLAAEYGVPLAFVQTLCAWQFSADDALPADLEHENVVLHNTCGHYEEEIARLKQQLAAALARAEQP